jgi:RNA polymerase sigma-70 factor (ECF subfamily)
MKLSVKELFDEHHMAVYRYLRKMTGSSDLAEELTQDVFIRIIRGLPKYREEGRVISWIFKITRNVLANRGRRERNIHNLVSLDEVKPISNPARQADKIEIEQALMKLKDMNREVFLLKEIAGLSYEEISRISNLTTNAVRSRVYHARLELRSILSMNNRHY